MSEQEQQNRTQEDSRQGEGSRYSDKQRLFAKIGLIVIACLVVILAVLMISGYDASRIALPALAMMILGPVFLWLMMWSYTRMVIRSCEANDAALQKQFLIPDTVVFDIGNVLADFSWQTWLAESGYSQDIRDRIAKASVHSPVWNEVDRGVWTYEEFVDGIVKNDPELETEIRTLFAGDYRTMITKRERAIPWVQALKDAGYRVFYLSNFSEKARRECADALRFLDIMDGGVFSYLEHLTKPDEAIFRLLIDRYGIDPKRAVFIDDMEPNVEAARRLGFHGIVFSAQEQAEGALRALGVNY